ncbi:MAG: hypothetical protein AAGA31_15735, partial [Bacteroidota bacterium]
MLRYRFNLTLWLCCFCTLASTCGRAQVPRTDRTQDRLDEPDHRPIFENQNFQLPPNFTTSPLGVPHFSPARQASTAIKGPTSSNCLVQARDFEQSLGKDVGTSPWHMVSANRYPSSQAVTIWGASLTDAYRFLVDGNRFEALDLFPINYFPTSITWNLFSTDDGRVIVPDASGYRINGKGMKSTNPSWLILQDGNGDPTRSEMRLTDIIEFEPAALRRLV